MNTDESLQYKSATELVSMLQAKLISSVELVEGTITRIESFDKNINAVVVRDFDRARDTARSADKAIKRGETKPLLGLPITVKESFNVTGLTTSWGNPEFKHWIPDEDALVISRLKDAGAIIIGKTNVPMMLSDWQTSNDIYGTTNNPWKLSHTPGGSSGGSAAALAAGFTSLELGSDLAGSIRAPAHFCGVFGHRPSVKLVPMRGTAPPPAPASPHTLTDFAIAGPMARTADDLSLALQVLAGPDKHWDGNGYRLHLPPARHHQLKDYRVLIIHDHPLCPTSMSTHQLMDKMVCDMENAKVKIARDIHGVPDLAEISRTFVAMVAGFISANLREHATQKLVLYAESLQSNDTSLLAEYLRNTAISYKEWLSLSRKQNVLRQQWRQLYKAYDVILCPVMPTPAFLHNHSAPIGRMLEIDNERFEYSCQYAWVSIASLFGLPATVVPIGYTQEGLPLGIQVIGDYLEDNSTIEFAKLTANLAFTAKQPSM